MAILISADDIKQQLQGYTPDKSGDFHVESAKLADRQFDECLKSSNLDIVILMSGGPASGKTEFISSYLINQNIIIFDGVLPSELGAKIKITKSIRSGKHVSVYAI